MSKFKVGDRVRRVRDSNESIPVNSESFHNGFEFLVQEYIEDYNEYFDGNWYHNEENLELVEVVIPDHWLKIIDSLNECIELCEAIKYAKLLDDVNKHV